MWSALFGHYRSAESQNKKKSIADVRTNQSTSTESLVSDAAGTNSRSENTERLQQQLQLNQTLKQPEQNIKSEIKYSESQQVFHFNGTYENHTKGGETLGRTAHSTVPAVNNEYSKN